MRRNGKIFWGLFFILAAVYFVMMFIGHLILAKPEGWVEPQTKSKDEGIIATLKTEPIAYLKRKVIFLFPLFLTQHES